MVLQIIGAACAGFVIGFTAYKIFHRQKSEAALPDELIIGVIVIGGVIFYLINDSLEIYTAYLLGLSSGALIFLFTNSLFNKREV